MNVQDCVRTITDHYFNLDFADCTMYPEHTKIMFCLRKELGLTEDNVHGIEVNATNFNVNNIVREKRNKKAGEVLKGLKEWQQTTRCTLMLSGNVFAPIVPFK